MCNINDIVEKLLKQIEEGIYKPHDKLPSENTLADFYNTPRINIRRAYDKLEEMGYTYSMQGKGRYLCDYFNPIELVLTGGESFTKKMRDKGYELVSKNLFCEPISFDPRIYNKLQANKTDKVYRIGRVRNVNHKAAAIHISYVLEETFPNIKEEGKQILSMFEYYCTKGYEKFLEAPSILSISYGSKEEREALNCSKWVPLITVQGNCRDEVTQKILEYTVIKYRGDCFTYII